MSEIEKYFTYFCRPSFIKKGRFNQCFSHALFSLDIVIALFLGILICELRLPRGLYWFTQVWSLI